MARYKMVKDGSAVLLHRASDVQTWSVVNRHFPKLKNVTTEFTVKFPTGPDLLRDTFWWFVKKAPVFGPMVPMKPTHVIHEALLTGLTATEEFTDLRALGTAQDEVAASIATIAVANALARALTPEQQQMMQALAQACAGMSEGEGKGEGSGSGEGGEGQDAPDKPDSPEEVQAKADAAAKLEAQRQNIRDLTEKLLAQVGSIVAGVSDQLGKNRGAQGEVARQAEDEHAYGGYGTAEVPDVDQNAQPAYGHSSGDSFMESFNEATVAAKFQLAKTIANNPLLHAVATFLGRVEMMANEMVVKGAPVPEETIGVEQGRSLSRMVPAARMKLGDPLLALTLAKDLMDGAVDQYEMEGEEAMGLGPLAIVCDSSGSMQGEPDIITKAITLALLRRAYVQRRDAMVVSFSGRNQTRVWTFPRGRVKTVDAVEMAAHTYGGSTDFDGWIREVTKAVKTARFAQADVLVITDGQGSVEDVTMRAWQATRTARSMRSVAVLIGGYGHDGDVLHTLCDKILPVSDITNPLNQKAVVDELFGAV